MDIFADLLNAVKSKLNNDAFFNTPVACEVLAETLPEIRKTGNDLLNTAGIVGIVAIPDLDRIEGDRFVLKGTVEFQENVKQNTEGTGGANKTGSLCVQNTIGLLQRYRVPILNSALVTYYPYSPLLITHAGFIGEVGGTNVWEVEFETLIGLAA